MYTGRETRSVMNTSHPSTKIGLLDVEMNNQVKVLFLGTLSLALVMIALKVNVTINTEGKNHLYIFVRY